MDGYSLKSLLAFLDYLGEKGLANKATVSSRQVSCRKVLGILDEEEASDLRNVDLEGLMTRFANLQGANYNPDSLRVYRSRVGKSLEEFFRYKENPANYRVSATAPKPKTQRPSSRTDAPSKEEAAPTETPAQRQMHAKTSTIDIPVALRAGCIIQVNGLPVDLKQTEAQKIANVIMAMVAVEEE